LRGLVRGGGPPGTLASAGIKAFFYIDSQGGGWYPNGVVYAGPAQSVQNGVSGAVALDGAVSGAFVLNMTGTVTAVTVANMAVGTRFRATFVQDASGTLNVNGISSYFKSNDPKGLGSTVAMDYTNRGASRGCSLDCYV